MSHSWRQAATKTRSVFSRRRTRSTFKARPRLSLEPLESRTLLSVVAWNNPNGGDWNTASNWSGGVVPGPNDDVVIDLGSPGLVAIVSGMDAVNSITTGSNSTLYFGGGALQIYANSTLNGPLSIRSGSLYANGVGTTLAVDGATAIDLMNTASFNAVSGATINLPH